MATAGPAAARRGDTSRLTVGPPAASQPWRAEPLIRRLSPVEFDSLAELASFLARLTLPAGTGGLR